MADKARCGLVFALTALLCACSSGTAEDRLRETIAAMEIAVEEKRSADFLDHVAKDFRGDEGAGDRDGLRRVLAANLLGGESISVVSGPLEVTMHGENRATVRLDALVTGGRFLPERGEHLRLETGWRVEGGEWRVYAARRMDR